MEHDEDLKGRFPRAKSTPREPDRYEAKARDRYDDMALNLLLPNAAYSYRDVRDRVAAALRAEAFAPLGDNHHNAAACPHCGDLLSKEKAKAALEALERAAQVAKQSQEDCFCKDKSDELLGGMPCAACMEAARIEGTLRGLADRAMKPDSADLLTKNKAADAIAAALRAERGDALDEAAKYVESFRSGAPSVIAAGIRALIPPAAAPAAETENFQPASEQDSRSADAQVEGARPTGCQTPLRGTASGLSSEARIAELETALRDALNAAHHHVQAGQHWVCSEPFACEEDCPCAKLPAGAAPQSGEGK